MVITGRYTYNEEVDNFTSPVTEENIVLSRHERRHGERNNPSGFITFVPSFRCITANILPPSKYRITILINSLISSLLVGLGRTAKMIL